MIKIQEWVIKNNQKVVILFEGRDAAGKGGAIRRITEHINPRHFKIVALHVPTEDEKEQWFFQRYINKLPNPGEMVFFDRSWYNHAVVEPINGFCSQEDYNVFMNQVNPFEQMLVESNTFLIKFYFSITKTEQEQRFFEIKNNPLKRWKMTLWMNKPKPNGMPIPTIKTKCLTKRIPSKPLGLLLTLIKRLKPIWMLSIILLKHCPINNRELGIFNLQR